MEIGGKHQRFIIITHNIFGKSCFKPPYLILLKSPRLSSSFYSKCKNSKLPQKKGKILIHNALF